MPNAKIRGQLAQFVTRIPEAEACDVARWYVLNANDLFTMSSQHSIDVLLKNAEKHRNSWAGAVAPTYSQSKIIDRQQGMVSTVESVIAINNSKKEEQKCLVTEFSALLE